MSRNKNCIFCLIHLLFIVQKRAQQRLRPKRANKHQHRMVYPFDKTLAIFVLRSKYLVFRGVGIYSKLELFHEFMRLRNFPKF